ncbi:MULTISPECIES: alpha/beta fold hydrolase [Paenibacillus]|uniref:Pimeloyl-ACP methyl ester carboxylesterase n=1 Tax=Paenibacillus lactis TaxID=228574 RepID=A0ABS4FIJ3_9BACL|nr:alpha/beta hydrolase [Paenibacillus lactis]MBP1896070.1 pimeloyl-ACP methyl ester carboxylesterase [Paenibacillus lactis]MCM3495524.1 alpha/beta hydrolase [Paenibacillus lactis]GIO90465.1 hydrolase [Paenibacillus lactis]HAG00730.1 alpha/beta hydrolase [Paenibacillus lactis]
MGVGSLNLYVKESGNQDASRMMVFLHGGGVSGWMWNKQVSFFKDSWCLVPDLPGHGRSSGDHVSFSIKETAEQICDLISAKADGREVVVVGFSLGAQILVDMMCQNPELIHYAVVNSALLRPMPAALRMIVPSVRLSFPLMRRRWFSKLQAGTLYVGEDDFEHYYAESLQMNQKLLVSVLTENMSYSLSPQIAESNARLLVTVGEKERGIMRKSAEDLVGHSDRAVGVVFPGIGHGIPLANPELFNHVVDGWLGTGAVSSDVDSIRANPR